MIYMTPPPPRYDTKRTKIMLVHLRVLHYALGGKDETEHRHQDWEQQHQDDQQYLNTESPCSVLYMTRQSRQGAIWTTRRISPPGEQVYTRF